MPCAWSCDRTLRDDLHSRDAITIPNFDAFGSFNKPGCDCSFRSDRAGVALPNTHNFCDIHNYTIAEDEFSRTTVHSMQVQWFAEEIE